MIQCWCFQRDVPRRPLASKGSIPRFPVNVPRKGAETISPVGRTRFCRCMWDMFVCFCLARGRIVKVESDLKEEIRCGCAGAGISAPRWERGLCPITSLSKLQQSQLNSSAAVRLQILRRATLEIRWLASFDRIRSARGRVGKMFSRKLTRLISFQIFSPVSSASSSVIRENLWK